MLIYCAHSRSFDFHNDFYHPLNVLLGKDHTLVLPHEQGSADKNSKHAIEQCDLVLAEVSYASTGLGIELGWADTQRKTILGFYKDDAIISSSLRYVIQELFPYKDTDALSEKVFSAIETFKLGNPVN